MTIEVMWSFMVDVSVSKSEMAQVAQVPSMGSVPDSEKTNKALSTIS